MIVLSGILPVFMIIGLGVFARRMGWIDETFIATMVGVFLMAAPTSVVSAAIAQGMGGDAELAGAIVVVTSLASFASYILWALVL